MGFLNEENKYKSKRMVRWDMISGKILHHSYIIFAQVREKYSQRKDTKTIN